jgi:hypothetical protein
MARLWKAQISYNECTSIESLPHRKQDDWIALSVQRRATGLKVRGSNPEGSKKFYLLQNRKDRVLGQSVLLFNEYPVLFLG